MHDSLLRQRSALLLHIKFGHPQSPQHLQTAGVSAVGGQRQLHLQQTLQERVDGLRLKGFHNDVTCVRKRKALTLSAASLTEKHEDSKASSRTSISGCSASAHPSCPPALVHRAVRQPAASTYNTHTHCITTLLKHRVSADLDGSLYLKARGGRADHFGQEQQHTDSGQQLWAVLDKQETKG